MSAWSKQAVPLVFLEICMGAIIKSNGDSPTIRRINARVDRWMHECWEPLRSRTGQNTKQGTVNATLAGYVESV